MIESHPAKGRTGLDDLVEAAVFAFSDGDGFLRAQVVAEDFGEQLPAATNLGRETLADYITQSIREANAQLLFFADGKEAEDTVDRLAGVDGVQCAKNKVTGLRGHENDFHGGAVAHFADKDNLWCLTQRRTQAIRIVVKILPKLALIDRGLG